MPLRVVSANLNVSVLISVVPVSASVCNNLLVA
jgi:hypothetical protein